MKDQKREVQGLFEALHSGTIDYYVVGEYEYKDYLKYLREKVRESGLTLKDIGTSKKELRKLWVKSCKTSAQQWLKALRSGTDHYESFLEHLREGVRKGGFTLEDIGTSKKELKELRIKGCKISAKRCLEFLRSEINQYQYESFLKYLLEEVRKGGFTLEDIGTSEEELEELRPVTVMGTYCE